MTQLSSLISLSSQPDGWPEVDGDAFYGLAGDIVRAAEPHTEADPVGVLVSLLVSAGCAIGCGPHMVAGNAPHPARLSASLVGRTAKGRKGTAGSVSDAFMRVADPDFMRHRVLGGFGSGEAVVDEVRDGTDDEPGSPDKRLLVAEGEMARILKVARRDGSTLSMTIRDAWDGSKLQARSRSATSQATGHHVAILGHITLEELRLGMSELETANGFGNRFLWVLVRQARRLPAGGNVPDDIVRTFGRQLGEAIRNARRIGVMHRNRSADELWSDMYEAMCDDAPGGMLEAVISRDQPQVLRLSVAYALLDGTATITPDHLRAAWAVWRYCRASAAYIFGDAMGDPIADRVYTLVREANGEVDRTAISTGLSHHASRKQLDEAIAKLLERGLIQHRTEKTGGRDRHLYSPAKKAEQAKEAPDLLTLPTIQGDAA